jgi:hypothetical protein
MKSFEKPDAELTDKDIKEIMSHKDMTREEWLDINGHAPAFLYSPEEIAEMQNAAESENDMANVVMFLVLLFLFVVAIYA